MPRDIIVVGGSAGGVEVLLTMVAGLPANLEASIFAVIHTGKVDTQLPRLLSRRGPLEAVHPEDGEPFERGRIYLAPPDRHLVVDGEHLRLTRSPKENRHRPAIDPLFRTAAAHGPHAIGVILSGSLGDGAAGLYEVKTRGGLAVVQDPTDALIPTMPQNALTHVAADVVVPAAVLASTLARLSAAPVSDLAPAPAPREHEELSAFVCPECGGSLTQRGAIENAPRFICRTGHSYSPECLLEEQTDGVEAALWAALRTLEERRSLAERMARAARERGHTLSEDHFRRMLDDTMERERLIRAALRGLGFTPGSPDGPPNGPPKGKKSS